MFSVHVINSSSNLYLCSSELSKMSTSLNPDYASGTFRRHEIPEIDLEAHLNLLMNYDDLKSKSTDDEVYIINSEMTENLESGVVGFSSSDYQRPEDALKIITNVLNQPHVFTGSIIITANSDGNAPSSSGDPPVNYNNTSSRNDHGSDESNDSLIGHPANAAEADSPALDLHLAGDNIPVSDDDSNDSADVYQYHNAYLRNAGLEINNELAFLNADLDSPSLDEPPANDSVINSDDESNGTSDDYQYHNAYLQNAGQWTNNQPAYLLSNQNLDDMPHVQELQDSPNQSEEEAMDVEIGELPPPTPPPVQPNNVTVYLCSGQHDPNRRLRCVNAAQAIAVYEPEEENSTDDETLSTESDATDDEDDNIISYNPPRDRVVQIFLPYPLQVNREGLPSILNENNQSRSALHILAECVADAQRRTDQQTQNLRRDNNEADTDSDASIDVVGSPEPEAELPAAAAARICDGPRILRDTCTPSAILSIQRLPTLEEQLSFAGVLPSTSAVCNSTQVDQNQPSTSAAAGPSHHQVASDSTQAVHGNTLSNAQDDFEYYAGDDQDNSESDESQDSVNISARAEPVRSDDDFVEFEPDDSCNFIIEDESSESSLDGVERLPTRSLDRSRTRSRMRSLARSRTRSRSAHDNFPHVNGSSAVQRERASNDVRWTSKGKDRYKKR